MFTEKTTCNLTNLLQQRQKSTRNLLSCCHLVCFIDSIHMASSAKILVLFKQYAPHFALLDTEVLFVTADDETAIARWKELSAFDFTIIADPSKQLYRDFSLIQPKVTFGKVYDVIYKHVFLYDEKWQLCQRYRRITPQLPEKILDDILALRKE